MSITKSSDTRPRRSLTGDRAPYASIAMSNAFNRSTQIFSNRSLKTHVLLKRRPSSSHRNNRKDSFYLPTNLNCNGTNRTFDVQYSFSLSQSWLTKINQQQCRLSSTLNFVHAFVQYSVQTALLQAGLSSSFSL